MSCDHIKVGLSDNPDQTVKESKRQRRRVFLFLLLHVQSSLYQSLTTQCQGAYYPRKVSTTREAPNDNPKADGNEQ